MIAVTITQAEAERGCKKVINHPGFAKPISLNLKPGMKDGTTILIKNALVLDQNGKQVSQPVYIKIHVTTNGSEKKQKQNGKNKKKLIVIAVICFIILVSVFGTLEHMNENSDGNSSQADDYQKPSSSGVPNNSTNSNNGNQDITTDHNEGVVFNSYTKSQFGEKTAPEILADIIANDNYFKEFLLSPTHMTITDRRTDIDNNTDYIECNVQAQNTDFVYSANYKVYYKNYAQGWLLESCSNGGNFYCSALNAISQSVVDNEIQDKYDTVLLVSRDRQTENAEVFTYNATKQTSDYLTLDYEVTVRADFNQWDLWTISSIEEKLVSETWDISGEWEYSDDETSIFVNILDFDPVKNLATLEYSVVTYIDLDEYQADPYYATTTRITPGVTYKGKSQFTVYLDSYGDYDASRTIYIEDATITSVDKSVIMIDFIGIEDPDLNSNEGKSTGVLVSLVRWGGKGTLSYWLDPK